MLPEPRPVRLAGLVLVRQRPGTASGVIFVTLEDETGVTNLVISPKVFERHRRALLGARLLGVEGKIQREGLVVHVIVERLTNRTALLAELSDLPDAAIFDDALAHADEVRKPMQEVKITIPMNRMI